MDSFLSKMQPHAIDSKRRVTFEVDAPDAKEVKVINMSDPKAMGAEEYDLKKEADGLWRVTTKPCRPGFHYYDLSVDGFRCADPASEVFFGWGKWTSGLEVPDAELDFYHYKDVPHGSIRHHWYSSGITETPRRCVIYTPPGYDEDADRRYPVLYLQHGSGECELSWSMQGRAAFILDNLAAEESITPMLVVMDRGYAAGPGVENPHRPAREDNEFPRLVIDELIPLIDANYRTLGDREHRAIAGLSMGAGQALNIGLHHLDLFSCIGAFSGGGRNFDIQTSFPGVFSDPEKFNRTVRLFWMGCGDLDRGYESAQAFHQALDMNGIDHVWYPGPGSHEWQVWRRHLYEFAQMLFRR